MYFFLNIFELKRQHKSLLTMIKKIHNRIPYVWRSQPEIRKGYQKVSGSIPIGE